MSVAGGKYRKTTCPKGVSSHQSCSTSRSNSLRANPDKTQVTVFHLRNKDGIRSLKVVWNKTELENTHHTKYLGVTLDRTLCYKQHIHNTKMNVATRTNLLRKLSNSKWGANAGTIRTTALALSYSVAEYAHTIYIYIYIYTKHRQHNTPSQTKHHPTTHRQQSTKGQKHRHTSNQHKRH